MFAIIAAILFGVALLLDLLDRPANEVLNPTTLVIAGLVCVAVHLAGVGTAWRGRRWRRR